MLRQNDTATPLRVSDLIAYLRKLPQDAVVIQSHDSEGNRVSLTHELWDCHYRDEVQAVWVGDGSPPPDARAAVCFWPAE